MLLKILSSFLLVSSFLTYSLASPSRNPIFDSSSKTSDTRGASKDYTEGFEKSFKELIQNSQWTFNHLGSVINSSFEEGFKTVMSYVADFQLRTEFFMMADGSHNNFPLNENAEMEQGYKAVAIAGSKLLMSLKTMERADEIMKNATRYLLLEDSAIKEAIAPKNSNELDIEKVAKNIIHEYFKFVSHQMETDEILREEYKKLLNEAREAVKRDPTMHGPFLKAWEKHSETKYATLEEMSRFLNDKKSTFRQAVANKLFLKESVKHFSMIYSSTEYERYLLARALIQKSTTYSSRNSKINDVYQQALTKAGEVVSERTYDVVGDVLFESLNKTLESNHILGEEVKALKMQVARNTKYNFDMFHVDFNLL